MKIKSGKQYRIKGKSAYFKKKYGTSNPIIHIENTDLKVFGQSWGMMQGNPTALIYAIRSGTENVPQDGTVWYGKVELLGELVNEAELEPISKES